MSIFETVGTCSYEALLADPQGADVIAIPCEPGNGTVSIGTVMYRKDTGLWAPAAAAQAVATNQLVVLGETVNTTGMTVTGGTVAVDAKAYRAGHMIKGNVKLAANAAVTDAIAVVLRAQGIVLDMSARTSTFNNVKAAG